MTKKERALNIFKAYFPYLVIVLAAILSCFIYFLPGIARGDDIAFHLSMTNDVLYGFEHGYFGLSTNHLHMGGFAINNFGFYGPVTHYGAAIFTFLFRWAGATASTGLKFMVVSSAMLGGIYMYRLAMRISKGNRIVSLITAVLFVFLPYRIFCALCRCAIAESIAMALIPMVFYGAYSFLHDKKWRVEPYVAFAIGAALVVLSHAFTGLITAIFGFGYILFNIKGVYENRRNYKALISMGGAIVTVVFLVLFYVLNSYYYESTNLYNLSNAERQWTTYEYISSETSRTYDFSGFLNLIYIGKQQGGAYWTTSDSVSSLIFTSILYFATMILAVLTDCLLISVKINKYFRHPIVTAVAFILPLVFQVRVEVYIAIAISLVLYFFVTFMAKTLPSSNVENRPLSKNVDLYYLIVSILICLALLFVPVAWKFVPSIMYQGQFAWRMWSITSFLVAMLVCLLLSHFQYKKALFIASSIAVCGIMTLTMGTTEKRVLYIIDRSAFITNDGYEYAKSVKYSGAQNEMAPRVFYYEEEHFDEEGYPIKYTPAYTNSLYGEVKNRLRSYSSIYPNFFYTLEDYIDPVFLEGAGSAQITEYNSPNNKFHIEVTSETALIQFPQFYYSGYTMYSGSKSLGKAKNVDGLISFDLKQGTYDVRLSFKSSKGYQISRPLFYIGLFNLVSGGVFGYIYRTKLMKKEEDLEQSQPEQC